MQQKITEHRNDNFDHVIDAVAFFDSERNLEAAIDELLTNGFSRADISLLAGEKTVQKKLGRHYRSVKELEDSKFAPHVAYVSREAIGDAEGAVIGAPMYLGGVLGAGGVIAAGGPISIALAAAATTAGAGAAIGALFARMIGQRHADYIEDQLEHGGILLWVRAWNKDEEKKALRILKSHSGHDVHIHDFSKDAQEARTPESILRSETLSKGQKIALLKQWEFDVREMLVAEDEGMGDCNGALLSRILNALSALEKN